MKTANFQRYIPEGSKEISQDDTPAVAYVYQALNGEPVAVAYRGKAKNPAFHCRFRSDEQCQQHIENFFVSVRADEQRKAEKRAACKGFTHGYQVGDILHHSWGYDPTQCDYYQVIATTKSTITIQRIGSRIVSQEGFMCDRRMPQPDAFLSDSKPIRKVVKPPYKGKGKGCISTKHGCMDEWDGNSNYCSWYH